MTLGTFLTRAAPRVSWRNLREIAWVLAGQAAALLGSVGLTKIVASQLGAEQYGRYALGLTVAVLLNQFLLGPVTTSAIRFFSVFREERRLHAFLAALRRTVGIVAAGVLAAAVLAAPYVTWRYGIAPWLLLAASATLGLAQNVFGLMNGLEIAARHRARAAVCQAADPVLRLAGAALVLWLVSRTATAAMTGVAAGMAVAAIVQWLTLSRSLVPALAAETATDDARQAAAARRTVLGYAKYFMAAGAFAWLQLSSDRWAVKVYLDDASVGLFAVAYQIASVPAVILAGCVSQFISPIAFQRAQSGTSPDAIAAVRRASFVGVGALVAVTAVSCVLAVAFGEPLVVFFTSPAYRASSAYIAPLVLGLGLLQVGHMLSLLPMSSNRLRGHLVVKVVHGLAAVTMNALAVRAYGLPGVCAAAVAGGMIYVALVTLNNHRIMRTLAPDAPPPIPAPILQP
jgi:O-antigen/teichoic acid export membrane protein